MTTDDEWLRARHHLRDHRHELGTGLHPDVPRVAGTPLLTAPGWIPDRPVPLADVALDLDPSPQPAPDVPEPRYSALMTRLACPAVFENRVTYRLRDAVLDTGRPRLRFGLGRYFDGIDTGEALAHEVAAARLAGSCDLPTRTALGSPVDLRRRPVNVAISALTIRDGVAPRFLVHRRDPAAVAHAGGLLQVLPVGVFQPVAEHTADRDLSLWRCLQREFAEELLGEDEPAADAAPEEHEARPVVAALDRERRAGTVRPYCLGLGVDPLTLATDLLCAVVVDGPVFDRVFAGLVTRNAEGAVSDRPFTVDAVRHLVRREPVQAAGAAVLALARRHRAHLLTR